MRMILDKNVEAYSRGRRQWQWPAGDQESTLRAPSHRARVNSRRNGYQSPTVSEQETGTGDSDSLLYANKAVLVEYYCKQSCLVVYNNQLFVTVNSVICV